MSPEAGEILGVIGVLRDAAGRVLMVERSAHVRSPGLWCFPGGHVEPGETLHEAVARELLEELGLTVVARQHLGFVRIPGSPYRLEVLTVEHVSGDLRPHPAEVADARYVTIDEVAAVGRPMPSNAAVVELLRRLA